MSDTLFEPPLEGPPIPNTYNPIFAASGIKPGMVVSASSTPNAVVAGNAAAAATSAVTGIYLGPAPSTGGKRGNVRYSGIVALELPEWSIVIFEAGALIAGAIYYVASGSPGKITATPPAGEGNEIVQVGVALSPSSLLVQIGPPAAAGGGSSPTVEHITAVAGSAVANPAKDVTYVTGDNTGLDTVTLANGSVDGQEKTICTGANDGGWHITPAAFANGTQVAIAATGSATFRWNSVAVEWFATAVVGGTIT
jgi:hypothetical protein